MTTTVDYLVNKFPGFSVSITRLPARYCMTPAQLEYFLRLDLRMIWTGNFGCRDEPGRMPADFIDVLTRTEQRPKLYVGDTILFSKFLSLSTITDWERLSKLTSSIYAPTSDTTAMATQTSTLKDGMK